MIVACLRFLTYEFYARVDILKTMRSGPSPARTKMQAFRVSKYHDNFAGGYLSITR